MVHGGRVSASMMRPTMPYEPAVRIRQRLSKQAARFVGLSGWARTGRAVNHGLTQINDQPSMTPHNPRDRERVRGRGSASLLSACF